MTEQTVRRTLVIDGEEVEYEHTNYIDEKSGKEFSTPQQAIVNTFRAFKETQQDLDSEYIDYVNEEFWNLI